MAFFKPICAVVDPPVAVSRRRRRKLYLLDLWPGHSERRPDRLFFGNLSVFEGLLVIESLSVIESLLAIENLLAIAVTAVKF